VYKKIPTISGVEITLETVGTQGLPYFGVVDNLWIAGMLETIPGFSDIRG
jgi:hypothetical protein